MLGAPQIVLLHEKRTGIHEIPNSTGKGLLMPSTPASKCGGFHAVSNDAHCPWGSWALVPCCSEKGNQR